MNIKWIVVRKRRNGTGYFVREAQAPGRFSAEVEAEKWMVEDDTVAEGPALLCKVFATCDYGPPQLQWSDGAPE